METIAELFRRRIGGALGIVSTAYIADATPAALCAHTRDRTFLDPIQNLSFEMIKNFDSNETGSQYASVVVEYLNSAEFLNSTFKWPTSCKQPDVIFG